MATSKKTAPKKTAPAAKKAAPRANPVQDIQEAMAKPFKGVTERLQALNIPGIAERFKDCLLYTSPSPRD